MFFFAFFFAKLIVLICRCTSFEFDRIWWYIHSYHMTIAVLLQDSMIIIFNSPIHLNPLYYPFIFSSYVLYVIGSSCSRFWFFPGFTAFCYPKKKVLKNEKSRLERSEEKEREIFLRDMISFRTLPLYIPTWLRGIFFLSDYFLKDPFPFILV